MSVRPHATFSFQRFAYLMFCVGAILYLLYYAQALFIPIAYGAFFALMLKPVASRFEDKLNSRVTAILLSLLTAGLAVGAIVFFFVTQIQSVLTEAEDIASGFSESLYEMVSAAGEMIGVSGMDANEFLEEKLSSAVAEPAGILTAGLSTTGALLVNFGLVMIYTFFFLLYRTAFKHFLLGQLSRESQHEAAVTLYEVQGVAKNYLGGMAFVMLILGVLNSAGLWAIGIEYPFVWGFLGALLAVIPYVGTTIGGLIPFLFAIATTETFWQPAAVVVLYMTVQFVEGNLITPKVVGNSVKINALAAVVALLIGAMFWGISGIVLAIPLLAMVRTVLSHVESTKPLALLLSDDLYDESERFLKEFNQPRYRLSEVFRGRDLFVGSKRRLHHHGSHQVSESDTEVVTDPEAN